MTKVWAPKKNFCWRGLRGSLKFNWDKQVQKKYFFYEKSHFFAYWRSSNRKISIESGQHVHIWVQSIIWRTQTRTEARTLAENWQYLNLGGHVPITFESQNLKIEKFSGKLVAFRWKSTRNTSFRHRTHTVDIAQFRNNGIWKSHDFPKNWPKMASKWVKMNFLGLVTNRKVVDND